MLLLKIPLKIGYPEYSYIYTLWHTYKYLCSLKTLEKFAIQGFEHLNIDNYS